MHQRGIVDENDEGRRVYVGLGGVHDLQALVSTASRGVLGSRPVDGAVQLRRLHAAGADFSSTNMTTWFDRMNGYSTLPAGKLELAMKIEADRLGRGLILDEERQPEMSVVRNEYEIGENDPSQALYKAIVGAAIVAHPYHWDTIGYRSDIEGVSTDTLRVRLNPLEMARTCPQHKVMNLSFL